jgi:hypothetical protein
LEYSGNYLSGSEDGGEFTESNSVEKHCRNTEDAAATPLTEGARLAASWTRSKMIFESHCKSIVNEIKAMEVSVSS